MVAMMTGVNALGKIGQQDWAAGGASIDQLLLAQLADAGRPDADEQDDVRIAAARRRRPLRPRRGRAARAVVQGADRRDRHRLQRRQPLYAETQPLNVFNRVFGGALPTGTDPAEDPGAEAVGLRLHAQGHRAHADADPGDARRTGWRPTLASITQLEASLRQTYASMPNTGVCTKPATPPTYANTSTGRQMMDDVDHRLHDRVRRRLLRRRARPTATRTWISA